MVALTEIRMNGAVAAPERGSVRAERRPVTSLVADGTDGRASCSPLALSVSAPVPPVARRVRMVMPWPKWLSRRPAGPETAAAKKPRASTAHGNHETTPPHWSGHPGLRPTRYVFDRAHAQRDPGGLYLPNAIRVGRELVPRHGSAARAYPAGAGHLTSKGDTYDAVCDDLQRRLGRLGGVISVRISSISGGAALEAAGRRCSAAQMASMTRPRTHLSASHGGGR